MVLMTFNVSMLNASEMINIFGLKNQDFAEVSSKKLNRYKINDNLMINIKLDKTDEQDGYMSKKSIGTIEGVFKAPILDNWVYTSELFLASNYKGFITLKDETGSEILFSYGTGENRYYDIRFYAGQDKRIEGKVNNNFKFKVLYINGKVTCHLDNKKIYTSPKRFGKLKSFTQQVRSNGEKKDILLDLNLQEIKK